MNAELFNVEANNIWRKAPGETHVSQLHIELELYKKLLNFFQVGDHFYLIFNLVSIQVDMVSNDVQTVLGCQPSEFNIEYLLNNIHPDDRPWFLNHENKARDFLAELAVDKLTKYKMRHDFRVRKQDGNYVRILSQGMVFEHDENGVILRTLVVFTDITHLKPEGKPTLSFVGLDGEPSYIDVDVKEVFAVSKEFLSKREKQILLLIIEGKLSKEISEILHISKQTVDSHRNNMLAKNKLKNTSELIAKAIKQGWI